MSGDSLSIRIDKQLRRELNRVSKRQNRSSSEIAREALRRYLALERFRSLRQLALPLAEAQGLVTDDDIFRLVS